MAALTPQVNASSPAAYCATLENFDLQTLFRIGQASGALEVSAADAALGVSNGSCQQQAMSMALRGYTEFEVTGQTETNDTVTTFNLSDKGVTFASGTIRKIELEALVTSDAEAAILRRSALVIGGTTPSVVLTTLSSVVDPAGTPAQVGNVGGGGSIVSVAGDFGSSNAIVPVVLVEQNSNKIRLSFTGITNIDLLWNIKVRVYPAQTQAFPVTD